MLIILESAIGSGIGCFIMWLFGFKLLDKMFRNNKDK